MNKDNIIYFSLALYRRQIRKEIEKRKNNYDAVKQHHDDNIKNLGVPAYEKLVSNPSDSLIEMKESINGLTKILSAFESQK